MFEQIRKKVERSLAGYMASLDRIYRLDSVSPLIASLIRDYVLSPGKRLRPVLFAAGYLGFAKKEAPGLYTSCLSIELLHDFMLIHDDIIDKADTRRGKPSMHCRLEKKIPAGARAKFSGQDLGIIIGDILYAMAIHTFLTIQEEPARKEKGLKRFIEAAMYTGSGEFIELMYGLNSLGKLRKSDIYKVYDYKTACYTFACPLSIGAILGGASDSDVRRLFNYGIYLGRAFQIKDDILGMFSEEKETGKSALTDLQEAKKTLLVLYAFKGSGPSGRKAMERIYSKKTVDRRDLLAMRAMIKNSGALEKAQREIDTCVNQSLMILRECKVSAAIKQELCEYARKLLRV